MGKISLGTPPKVDCDVDEAKLVVTGFCFGEIELRWGELSKLGVGSAVAHRRRPRWAYRTYDCVPASEGVELTMHDVLLTAGLDSRINSETASGIFAVLDDVNEALGAIPLANRFWDFSTDDLGSVPSESSPAWNVWRAWWLLNGVYNVNTATSHKILHHKRPWQFPLLDSETQACYRDRNSTWAEIATELRRHEDEFTQLESWFADLAAQEGGVSLTRLRLHDILLWCKATGQWEKVKIAGGSA